MSKYRTDYTMEDVRRSRRPAAVWMEINRFHGRCWCGKPKSMWAKMMRKYCCKKHGDWWHYRIAPYWDEIRLEIIQRDGKKCRMCHSVVETPQIDHIVPHAAGGEFWDLDNLQVLCESCHIKKTGTDAGIIKSNKMAKGLIPMDAFFVE